MPISRIRLKVLIARSLICFQFGVGIFVVEAFTLGTFFPIPFGCIYFGSLAMLAGVNGSLTVFTLIALGVPFLFEQADAILTGVQTLIASEIGCLVFQRLNPDEAKVG